MLPFKYAYFVGTIVFLIPWGWLYLRRSDLRKDMWIASLIVAPIALVADYVWLGVDWWHPETITGTPVGIEDVLLGFSNGGIAAVIYEVFFRKKSCHSSSRPHNIGINLLLILFVIIMSLLFFVGGLTSFTAFTIGACVIGAVLILLRPDLLPSAFLTGVLMVIVSLPAYYIPMWLSPGWVETTWIFEYLSGVLITGIPIEDLIFYFLFGFVVGTGYKYWACKRFVAVTSSVN